MNTQPSSLTPASILIADDTPTNLQLLAHMLRESGWKPRPVSDGLQALEAVRLSPPDLILLDVNMPGMNGYEVCQALKADERFKDIPVIFISTFSDTEDKVQAFTAGGVDYITKPFHFAEVRARVQTHLELRRQKQRVEENLVALQQLEIQRDNLTHMIVHDLRSPLMALSGFLDMIEMDELAAMSGDGRDYVKQSQAIAANITDMVSALLDVSKMEAGEMKIRPTPCDLPDICRKLLARFDALKGNLKIAIQEPPVPVNLLADSDLITRVIQNLVGNAIKFSPSNGKVIIDIALCEQGVRVSIIDEGIGIPPQYHQRIFEKFGQVEGHKHHIGTGLGLTFCRLAVEAHGGQIGVISDTGKGCTLWFTLPVAR